MVKNQHPKCAVKKSNFPPTHTQWLFRLLVLLLGVEWNAGAAIYIDPVWLAPEALFDRTKPGFKVRSVQAGFGLVNSLDRAEKQLSGALIDPITGQSALNQAIPGPNADGSYDEPGVINYDKDGSNSNNGRFNGPEFPDSAFPGIPGTGSGTDNFAIEAITFLELPAGTNTIVVNSDDGFRLLVGNRYIASNRTSSNLAATVGECDCGRTASDTIMNFVVSQAGVYPVRVIMEQGGGGASFEFFSVLNKTNRLLINDRNSPGSINAYMPSALRIVSDPADNAVAVGNTGVFSVSLVPGTSRATYQWQKAVPGSSEFSDIPGATSSSYTTKPVAFADNGARYRVRVSVGSLTALSHAAVLAIDNVAPTVLAIHGSGSLDQATLVFSKPVTAPTATNPANYVVDGGLGLLGGTISSDGTSVTFTTTRQLPGASYRWTINGVKDRVGNTVASDTQANLFSFVLQPGYLAEEFYFNHPNNTLDEIHSILDGTESRGVDQILYLPNFQKADESSDYYTDRIWGFLLPPVSGVYRFYLSASDAAELWLSTDDSRVNLQKIAVEPVGNDPRQWVAVDRRNPDAPENISDGISLEAGRQYYVELLHTAGIGLDTSGVTWQLPGAAKPQNGDPPIPGRYLATYVDPANTNLLNIYPQPSNTATPANSRVRLSFGATSTEDDILMDTVGPGMLGGVPQVQWQEAPKGSSNFTNIDGATGFSYTTGFLTLADNGTQFRATVSLPGIVTNTDVAVIAVTNDAVKPSIRYAISPSSNIIRVVFTEPVTATAANFKLSGGAVVTGAATDSVDHSIYTLTTSTLAAGSLYQLTAAEIFDLANNPLDPASEIVGVMAQVYSGDLSQLTPLPFDQVKKAGDPAFKGRGFRLKVQQNSGYSQGNRIAALESLLLGRYGTNEAPTNSFIETGTLNYSRPCDGFAGRIVPDAVFPVIMPADGVCQEDNFALEILAYVHLKPGVHRWGVNLAGGFRLSPGTSLSDSDNAITLGEYDGSRTSGETLFDFIAPVDGFYPMRFVYGKGGGVANLELFEKRLDSSNDLDPSTYTLINGNDDLAVFYTDAGSNPVGILLPPVYSNGSVSISWSSGGTLQSAPRPMGPWTDVSGQPASPYSVDPTGGAAMFYRLRQ
jgi:hypothetical protein